MTVNRPRVTYSLRMRLCLCRIWSVPTPRAVNASRLEAGSRGRVFLFRRELGGPARALGVDAGGFGRFLLHGAHTRQSVASIPLRGTCCGAQSVRARFRVGLEHTRFSGSRDLGSGLLNKAFFVFQKETILKVIEYFTPTFLRHHSSFDSLH